MNLKMFVANTLLILSGMVAGVLSSFVLITEGFPRTLYLLLPGMTLGAFLSLGVVLINRRNSARLSCGESPDRDGIITIAWVVGGAAAALIAIFYYQNRPADRGQLNLFPWQGALASIVYARTLLSAYHARWGRLRDTWVWLIPLSGVASGFAWGALYFIIPSWRLIYPSWSEGLNLQIFAKTLFPSIEIGFFKGLPFAFLWGLSVWLFNPAHTLERWQKINGKVDEVEKTKVD